MGCSRGGGLHFLDFFGFKQQAHETDRTKREAMLHQIQQLLYEHVRFGPIWEYIWPGLYR